MIVAEVGGKVFIRYIGGFNACSVVIIIPLLYAVVVVETDGVVAEPFA